MSNKEKAVTNDNAALASVVLDRTVSDKDQTIGAQREHIETLRTKIETLEADLAKAESEKEVISDDQKVIVVKQDQHGIECPRCSYFNSGSPTSCWDCGTKLTGLYGKEKIIEKRNLDDVIKEVRKEESKKLKIDNIELEKELEDTSFKLSKTKNELKAIKTTQSQEITDARREVRERYQKDMEEQARRHKATKTELNNKIDELVEENRKLEENKTDAEVEQARKQEIIDLKTRIEELDAMVEESKKLEIPRLNRFWKRMTARLEEFRLEDELWDKRKRVNEISNEYPDIEPTKRPWWKRGKYAKEEESNNGPNILWGNSTGCSYSTIGPW